MILYKMLLSWLAPFAFTVLIFFPLFSGYRPLFQHDLSVIKVYIGIFLSILYLSVAFYLFFWGKSDKTARLIWFSVVLFCYGYLIYIIEILVEQVHLIEYGIVTWLYYLSLRKNIKDKMVYYVVWLLIFFLGIVDEWIQFYLPARVGELWDIYLNGASAGLAIVLIAKVFSTGHTGPPVSFQNVRISCALSVFFLLSLGIFVSTVTDWGFRHKDPEFGTFYSHFTLEELREKDKRESIKYAAMIKEFFPEKAQYYLINQRAQDKFKAEILARLFRRERYENKGNYWVAFKENQILSNYFNESIIQSGYGWSKEKVSIIKQNMQTPLDKFYESPVSKGELIVAFGPATLWSSIFFMICGFIWIMSKGGEKQLVAIGFIKW